MSAWVKTLDQLPPDEKTVLVWDCYDNTAYRADYSAARGRWYYWADSDGMQLVDACSSVHEHQLTHWMPLPEPPSK